MSLATPQHLVEHSVESAVEAVVRETQECPAMSCNEDVIVVSLIYTGDYPTVRSQLGRALARSLPSDQRFTLRNAKLDGQPVIQIIVEV